MSTFEASARSASSEGIFNGERRGVAKTSFVVAVDVGLAGSSDMAGSYGLCAEERVVVVVVEDQAEA